MRRVPEQPPSWTLVQGDALELLNGHPAGSVDMVFADPPYNLSNGGFTVHAGRRVSVDKGDWDRSRGVADDHEFHRLWLAACRRVLRPGGTIWVSGTYHSVYSCGHAMQLLGYHVLNDICWYKPNASPNLSGRYFTASHETLLWARRESSSRHVFNYRDMKESAWEDRLKSPGRQMRSVWAIGVPRKDEKRYGKHPTQKPVALLDRIVRASTRPGDLVLDPFAGSGTTGVAAIALGRRFVGFELDEGYVLVAKRRLQDAEQAPLLVTDGESDGAS
jgi:site-specific DNA-methyltransferase (adenine-specific)